MRSLFVVENDTLSNIEAEEKGSFDEEVTLDRIQIWGVASNVSRVSLNDREIKFKYADKEHVSERPSSVGVFEILALTIFFSV